MGPIAFVLVFLLVPLLAAVLAVGFFAALGLAKLIAAVPTGLWATLAVAAVVAASVRLAMVLRTLRSVRPDRTR